MSNPEICVAGGGSWGTALAHLLATNGYKTSLWLRDAAVAEAVCKQHENPRYLPGFALHPSLAATTDPAVLGREIVVLAVPCQQLRGWLAANAPFFRQKVVLVNAAKGIETANLATCAEVTAQSLGHLAPRYAALSGPSFAADVLRGLPTAVVLATADEALGHLLRQIFSGSAFRCYSSTDVMGVEMGGAVKNVMAIAAGVCDGLGLGHNSRAALITRGLAEMSRLGVARGAHPHTFMGLSGLGDLTLTCTGDLSRNRQVGLRLGRGEKLEHITTSLGMVAEGVKTTAAIHELARRLEVEAPLTDAVYSILYEDSDPQEVLHNLMSRRLRDE
ncbi:NAD(P)-dependent glycerol-3-phosphate dehydrogenase [Desulfovibrio sp. UIB00]|uniref:NAD(P)H-dependent glycerol-3-phosphate dehydrogenase n=1 Tax=Desulfovibrio sp. UIB00 TaxID=2804314 RepID=UPI001F10D334|nr:NAD(P)H-dependent glycerol-3-phosphate dehydrogenase [Desulfovibrio sp. UIB00]MCH5143985.1 NAD(P)-dependent glycerol-3-phosphate dehydrogenase [Desulfovibrio sp. UIB00]